MQHNDLLGLAFGVRGGLPVITAKGMGELHELAHWKQWIFTCWSLLPKILRNITPEKVPSKKA